MKQKSFMVLIVFALFLDILFGLHPMTDRMTWGLENLPVWIGLFLLVVTRRVFPLSELVYLLLFAHSIILMVGGYYSYAKEPLFLWIQDGLHLERNHYDRLGHFAQGFVPAILVRELLLRTSSIGRGKWLSILSVSVCLAFSALFEIWEWRVAVWGGDSSTDYLGSQGDVWDAQWDMLMALMGASVSIYLLSGVHDRSLKVLNERSFRKTVY